MRRRSWWGWGFEDAQALPDAEAAAGIVAHLGFGSADVERPVPVDAVELPAPRIEAPFDTKRPPSPLGQ